MVQQSPDACTTRHTPPRGRSRPPRVRRTRHYHFVPHPSLPARSLVLTSYGRLVFAIKIVESK
jgi:hypothetical protein